MKRPLLVVAALLAVTVGCDAGAPIELLPRLDVGKDGGVDAAPDAAPASREFALCPTRIDVYGGANALLTGCGGPSMAELPIQEGYFEPGEPRYDATLAGRLQARLEADPSLTPLFGTSFRVRSCASSSGDLAQLVPGLAGEGCGFESPPAMGSLVDLCARDPAPVVLASIDATPDRCHGGGPDSARPDDRAAFAAHVFTRLDALRARRGADLLVIGPRAEWQPAPRPGVPDDGACLWSRGDWNRAAVLAWGAASPSRPDIFIAADPDDDRFRRHNRCCAKLGVPCDTGWYVGARGGNVLLNCDGAQAIVDFWYARLKRILVENRFRCP